MAPPLALEWWTHPHPEWHPNHQPLALAASGFGALAVSADPGPLFAPTPLPLPSLGLLQPTPNPSQLCYPIQAAHPGHPTVSALEASYLPSCHLEADKLDFKLSLPDHQHTDSSESGRPHRAFGSPPGKGGYPGVPSFRPLSSASIHPFTLVGNDVPVAFMATNRTDGQQRSRMFPSVYPMPRHTYGAVIPLHFPLFTLAMRSKVRACTCVRMHHDEHVTVCACESVRCACRACMPVRMNACMCGCEYVSLWL